MALKGKNGHYSENELKSMRTENTKQTKICCSFYDKCNIPNFPSLPRFYGTLTFQCFAGHNPCIMVSALLVGAFWPCAKIITSLRGRVRGPLIEGVFDGGHLNRWQHSNLCLECTTYLVTQVVIVPFSCYIFFVVVPV